MRLFTVHGCGNGQSGGSNDHGPLTLINCIQKHWMKIRCFMMWLLLRRANETHSSHNLLGETNKLKAPVYIFVPSS